MDADLTCRCQRATFVPRDFNDLCFDCGGTGRRRPTLAEWDALRAERDRLSEILGEAEEMLAEFHESIGRYVPDGVSVLVAERDRLQRACDKAWAVRANARGHLDGIRVLRSRGLPVADLLDGLCEQLSAPPWPGKSARAALDAEETP